jgi:hypothetical protein
VTKTVVGVLCGGFRAPVYLTTMHMKKALVNDSKITKRGKKKQKGKVYIDGLGDELIELILKKKIMTFIIGVFQSSILIIID